MPQSRRSFLATCAYHNHDFEFVHTGDVVPFDVLLADSLASIRTSCAYLTDLNS